MNQFFIVKKIIHIHHTVIYKLDSKYMDKKSYTQKNNRKKTGDKNTKTQAINWVSINIK